MSVWEEDIGRWTYDEEHMTQPEEDECWYVRIEERGTVGRTSEEKHLGVCPEELESLINQHRGAKKSFREGYNFSTKHGEIKREADSATRSWGSKRKRAANKIKRLLKEIERLEGEEVYSGEQRDIYQKILGLAVNYEEYIKSVITNE